MARIRERSIKVAYGNRVWLWAINTEEQGRNKVRGDSEFPGDTFTKDAQIVTRKYVKLTRHLQANSIHCCESRSRSSQSKTTYEIDASSYERRKWFEVSSVENSSIHVSISIFTWWFLSVIILTSRWARKTPLLRISSHWIRPKRLFETSGLSIDDKSVWFCDNTAIDSILEKNVNSNRFPNVLPLTTFWCHRFWLWYFRADAGVMLTFRNPGNLINSGLHSYPT